MLHDRDFPLRRNKDACRARDMRVAEVFGIDASNQAAEIAKTTPSAASSAVSLAVHKLLTGQKVLVTGPNSRICKAVAIAAADTPPRATQFYEAWLEAQ
jgi:hypothetical protein